MRIYGVIANITDRKPVSANFIKREVWLFQADKKFPQTIPVEFSNKNCDLLDGFDLGQEVQVTIQIRGRVWQDKCFVSLNGYQIEPVPVAGKTNVDKLGNWGTGHPPEDSTSDDLPF